MIKIAPLFSGSRGNCTLIRTPSQNILLDMGYGFRATVAKLNSLGIDPQSISAVLLTHEHSDHIHALPMWEKRFHTPIFAPELIANYLSQLCQSDIAPVCKEFDLNDLHIDVYVCSHDARQCFGYRFCDGKMSAASVTDTGEPTLQLVRFLSPCEKILLESNHDAQMLKRGDYPYPLKERILSKFGHLSNEQAASVLSKLTNTLRAVVLGHLSRQNNTEKLAYESAAAVFEKAQMQIGKDIFVYVADQDVNEIEI